MTNPHYAVLALCVDRSGSMMTVKDDAEGAVASIMERQKDIPGRCDVMLCDFNDTWHLVHSLRPVQDVPSYFLNPGGLTALLDAIAKTIHELGLQLDALHPDDRPSRVIVAIQTDGAENTSKEFTLEQVRALIEHQQNTYSWDFLFLGAGIDAFGAGSKMGIMRANTYSYTNDRVGTQSMADAVSAYVSNTRMGKPATMDGDAPIGS